MPNTTYNSSVLWPVKACCVIITNTLHTSAPSIPASRTPLPQPRFLLTQAHSALASSVPPPLGCPVAPPTCGTTSARTTTIESHLCPLAVCHARLACSVCSHAVFLHKAGLFCFFYFFNLYPFYESLEIFFLALKYLNFSSNTLVFLGHSLLSLLFLFNKSSLISLFSKSNQSFQSVASHFLSDLLQCAWQWSRFESKPMRLCSTS